MNCYCFIVLILVAFYYSLIKQLLKAYIEINNTFPFVEYKKGLIIQIPEIRNYLTYHINDSTLQKKFPFESEQIKKIHSGKNSSKSGLPILAVIVSRCNENRLLFEVPIDVYEVNSCKEPKQYVECSEAGAYLRFILQQYDHPVAENYLFIHGHNTSWHQNGGVNEMIKRILRNPNHSFYRNVDFCEPDIRFWLHKRMLDLEYHFWYDEIYQNLPGMDKNFKMQEQEYSCCAQFMVKKSAILRRPKEHYRMVFHNMITWSFFNYNIHRDGPRFYCGRLFEYTWHKFLANLTKVPPCFGDIPRKKDNFENDIVELG